MIILEVGFWFGLFLLVLAYPGYPLLLWGLSQIIRRSHRIGAVLPSLTLLIPAYNEAEVLGQKLDNALASDYPSELLQIIVISDASTDETAEIAASYAPRGVELLENQQRSGKTFGLNRAVEKAGGELLVFTDANAFFEATTLRLLVRGFADQTVGLVTGGTLYFTSGPEEAGLSMGLYSRLEHWLKKWESTIGSCVGADGAIFALRKELYLRLHDSDINDLVIPFNTLRQGYRVVQEAEAFCREEHGGGLKDEFARQVRISNRTLRALRKNRALLNPRRYGIFAVELFCHKWLRFLFPLIVPVMCILGLILGFFTSATSYLLFPALTLLLLLFSLIPVPRSPIVGHLKTFVVINLAMLAGWSKTLRNEVTVVWGDPPKIQPENKTEELTQKY